jgi:hypothetical protein
MLTAVPRRPAESLASVDRPLEADDEYEVIRGINQEGNQPLVVLAEM